MKRTLSIDELRHALATRLSDTELDQDNMISPRIVVESCLGLLVIEQKTQLSVSCISHFRNIYGLIETTFFQTGI